MSPFCYKILPIWPRQQQVCDYRTAWCGCNTRRGSYTQQTALSRKRKGQVVANLSTCCRFPFMHWHQPPWSTPRFCISRSHDASTCAHGPQNEWWVFSNVSWFFLRCFPRNATILPKQERRYETYKESDRQSSSKHNLIKLKLKGLQWWKLLHKSFTLVRK